MRQSLLSNYIWLLLLGGLQASQASADWQSLYYRDHILVGKIFSTQEKAWISPQQLDDRIREEQIVLLGETHSNPDHHIKQAEIIENWLASGRASALAFEMLAYDDWNESSHPARSAEFSLVELHQKLEEVSSQWDWEIYKPILALLINYQLPMVGANLTRTQLDEYSPGQECSVSRQGISLEFCNSLAEVQQASVKQLIFDAHCGYLPLEHTKPLLHIQLAKDASFALSVVNMGKTHKVALIAGAVHVRKDIGVPVHLQRLGKQFVSIAFLNVDPDKLEVEDYIDQAELNQQFDYIYFTPSERNQDPCVEFAEQLKKMKTLTK